MKKFRLLILTEQLGFGGLERQITELVKGFTQEYDNEYKIVVATFNGYEGFCEIISKYTQLYVLSDSYHEKSKQLKNMIKLQKLITTYQPHIIHAFSLYDNFYIQMLKMLGLINKKIIYINGSIRDVIRRPSWQQYLKKFLLNRSEYVVANSITGLKTYQQFEKKNRYVIYNGIDIKRFKTTKINNNGSEFKVSVVANLTNNKNHLLILDIASIFENIVSFDFIGDGPKYHIYKEIIKQKKIKNVNLLGQIRNIEDVLPNYDLSLLSSFKDIGEGISNAILENMAAKVPVLAPKIGAIPEIITDNETGFLFEVESSESLKSKLNFILQNKHLLNIVTNKAYDFVQAKFSLEKMIDNYYKLYNSLLR